MCVSLPQITSQLRGRHWLHPGGLAVVICQVPAPCRTAAGSYSQLTWFWLLRHAFLRLCYVNVDVFPALDGRRPSLRCFFAPADCSRWKLRLRLPPELVEETSPWHPVDVAVTGLRCYSQSSKVGGLDPGFSRAFQVESLDPGFLYAIHKHQAKISRFFIGHIFSSGFYPISVIHSRLWIFIRIFVQNLDF